MKNTFISNLFIFAVGAAIGSAVTWKMVKSKYEKIADEEIRSVREAYAQEKIGKQFSKGFNNGFTGVQEKSSELGKTIKSENDRLRSILDKNDYTDYSNVKKEREEDQDMCGPCVISPDEFGENEYYETNSLTYYADGVLTDELDDPMDDETIEWVVGRESLDHFGEYEDDSVFVRNDRLETYYEILADSRTYKEVHSYR